jgi:radical SAM protein with 4Fe4S-binding SPASM domain
VVRRAGRRTEATLSTPAGPNVEFYGFARAPERVERIAYGRFRNVYLYITEACQLRCGHCYMGERLERATFMPLPQVIDVLTSWRRMGGSKLSILGGEPTLHPNLSAIVAHANGLGYEQVILNTNGLRSAARKLRAFEPPDFAYIQVSLDGGSPATHDQVRGRGTFQAAWRTTAELAARGFDTRIICTVNKANMVDCLELLPMADRAGVSLVKYHVFSGIGNGAENDAWLVSPAEWIDFYEALERLRGKYKTKIWYQPTYARSHQMQRFAGEGYRGCIGRTLDRISIFPDGRAYVCSYLFDTDLNYANIVDGRIVLNKGPNEFDLFTSVLHQGSCGSCKVSDVCMGGCPAEAVVMGAASCRTDEDIVPVCRLWKSEV